MKRLLLTLVCFASAVFAETESFEMTRSDGSTAFGYLDRPAETSFPLVVLIDGEYDFPWSVHHDALAEKVVPLGFGVVSIEKRGVVGTDVDVGLLHLHDCLDARMEDHRLLFEFLKGEVDGWNKRCIVFAVGEGGMVAPRICAEYANWVKGLVATEFGGGVAFGDMMKSRVFEQAKREGPIWNWYNQRNGGLNPKGMNEQYPLMLEDPESLEIYGDHTWKWWSSYLSYDPMPDLLKLKMPIMMIHGALDWWTLVESADLVKRAFDEEEKSNLTYVRIDDMDFCMTDREDVYVPLLHWMRGVLDG